MGGHARRDQRLERLQRGSPTASGSPTRCCTRSAATSPTDYAQAFSDVTIGNNDNLDVGSGTDWPAGTGYDLATGLGTPRITDLGGEPGLASQLCTLAAGSEATAPPVVSSLSSSAGHSTGGGTLTVNGSNFGASTGSVFFGSVGAAVTLWTPTAVTVTIPPYYDPEGSPSGLAGSADVTVVTAGTPAESSTPGAASTYHYTAAATADPVVDYVSSTTGPAAGGGTATIVGSSLSGATAVHFGDVAATGLTPINADELQVTVPPSDGVCAVPAAQGLCAVAVTVTTPSGTSAGQAILPAYQGPIVFSPDGSFAPPIGCDCEVVAAPDEYDYAPAPTITSVAPAYASENGDSITITGTGFNLLDFEWANVGDAGVNFNEDFGIEGITPDSVELSVPAAPPTTEVQAVPLSVQSSGGLSNVSTLDYAGIPTVTGLSLHLASASAPGTVVVTGQGLSDVTSAVLQLQGDLDFLSSTSTGLSAQTDSSVTVAIPEGFAAPGDLLLCTETGCSTPDPQDSLTLAYPGRPVLTSSSPSAGPAHGTTEVTLTGALDSEVTAVDFGSKPATIASSPELTASGPITVLAPAGVAGSKVDITITTLGGVLVSTPRSAVTSLATFTYAASTPSAPLSVSATAGASRATVRWKAPADTGGHAITGYVVVGHAPGHASVHDTLSATTRSVTVLHLAAHVAWTFTVQAKNSLGLGLVATTGAVKPT